MFPLVQKVVGGYKHGQKTAYSPKHFGVDYSAKLVQGVMPFTGRVENSRGKSGGNTQIIYPDALYEGRKIAIRILHLDRFLVLGGNYKKGTPIHITGNTGMGVDANGNVTYNANPYHYHLDISWERLDLDNFDNFIDPEKFNWDYDTIPSMECKLSDIQVDGMPADKRIAALKDQVKKYGDIINSPTDGIAAKDRKIKEQEELLDSKRAQIEELKKQLESANTGELEAQLKVAVDKIINARLALE